MYKLPLTIAVMLIAFGFSQATNAQKLKDKKITINMVSIPTEKLPEEYKTYSVKVNGSGAGQAGLSREGIANRIVMDGFRRIEEANGQFGHLRLIVNTGYISSKRAEGKSERKTTKDKEGKETTTSYYWYNLPVSMSCNYKIVDPAGNILDEGRRSTNSVKSTKKYTSLKARSDNYSTQIASIKRKAANETVNSVVSELMRKLKVKYDFKRTIYYDRLYFVAKHDSEKGFQTAFDLTKAFFGNAENICMPSEEVLKELEAPLAFWKKHADLKANGDKKKARIITAANYNLALVNYYADQYDLSRKYAMKVITNEGKDKPSQRLVEGSRDLEERLKVHGLTSQRYCRDVANAAGPADVKAFEEEKEELAENKEASRGSIIYEENEIKGSFVKEEGDDAMRFGNKGNVKFVTEGETEMKEYDLTDEKVSSFTIGERKFVKQNFIPSAKGGSDVKQCILESVYSSEKISLLEYIPEGNALSDAKTEFALKKAQDQQAVSLLATQFLLFKKGMAKYFEDCPDLAEMFSGGELKMTREDLIKASRIYSELCE